MAGPPKFSVDTHLFRELGELLVGRESTALIELVKNAYDADATTVTVSGENLADPKRGVIRVADDGIGMDATDFVEGFLRIAARTKRTAKRRSKRYGRQYTGAKGIGRLAAHKLAHEMDIESSPWHLTLPRKPIEAKIDWDLVEESAILDDVDEKAITLKEHPPRLNLKGGTSLTLSRLRQQWTKTQLGNFLIEVEGLRPPAVLAGPLKKTVVQKPLLFDAPTVVDTDSDDPGIKIALEGEFNVGESYWTGIVDAASWLVEIDANKAEVKYGVAPTRKGRSAFPKAEAMTFNEPHPSPSDGPFFHARLLIREDRLEGRAEQKAWSTRVAGVRVYMEGFRVLPYGDDRDDWLSLQRDTSDRTRRLKFLEDSSAGEDLAAQEDEGLLLLPNKHYFGGVFLTERRTPTLEMLINREGFVPGAGLELLTTLVRRGIDLSTRVRAAARAEADDDDIDDTDDADDSAANTSSSKPKGRRKRSMRAKAKSFTKKLSSQAAELRTLAEEAPPPVARRILAAADEIERAAKKSKELLPYSAMLLILASVGTQLAAFTHEVNRVLSLASDLEEMASRLRRSDGAQGKALAQLGSAAGDLRRAIERQAAYLVDVVTPDARRRRSRQRVRDAVDGAWRLVAATAEKRGISLRNEVDEEHKSPAMFRAELTAVLSNLLTNAVKAAGEDGSIRVTSRVADDALVVRIENTGVEVNLADAERWFRPFESTTVKADPVLGQGMGLGLGITRDLLMESGATIGFTRPRRGFATALEIVFHGVAQ